MLGATAPFLPLYFQHLGFSPARIGELVAIPMLMRCLAPNLWGWLGDRSGQRLRIVRFGALCTLLSFCLIFVDQGYAWLALVMALHAFFWHAVLPQFEVITLAHLQEQTARYSQIRLWGSIGFIVAVIGLGELFQRFSPGLFPAMVALILAGILVGTLWVPNAVPQARAGQDGEGGFLAQLLRPGVPAFFLCVCLMQLSHGPYYTFLTLHLEHLGYERGFIGQMWALGVVAEIVLFLFMARILTRFSVRQVLAASFLLAALAAAGHSGRAPGRAAARPTAARCHLRQLPRRRHPFRPAQLRAQPAGPGPGPVRRPGRHRRRPRRVVRRLQLGRPRPGLDLRHRQLGGTGRGSYHCRPFARAADMNRERLARQIVEARRQVRAL